MISIIIPVYNVEQYLSKCLDSCLSQTYKNIEIITINDGSSDLSGKILDEYKLKDPRIKVIHKKNEGVAITRLIGINNASGDYLFFMDSDDTIPEDCIELLHNKIIEYHSDIVIGNYYECYPNGVNKLYKHPIEGSVLSNEYIKLLLLDKVANGVWGKLFNKRLAVNLISTTYKLGEDTTLLIQLVSNANKIVFTESIIYNYLQRPDSAVHIKKPSYLGDMYYYRLWVTNFLKSSKNLSIKDDLLDIYSVRGYIRCIFWGGSSFLSHKNYDEVKEIYKIIYHKIPFWERIVFQTIPFKMINTIVVYLLHQIRNLIK